MKKPNLFAQIAKIDEARREVWGVATSEVVDKDGEVFDYQSSKPYFKSWSDEIAKATDGKSLGNVREMHEPSAVGKLVDIGFDDELREIRVVAKIIDDHAWQKCTQGVYTGFSIGGAYVNAWKDGEYRRYTARPVEISVVDNPCNPGAHFTAVKADGTWEVRKFAPKTAESSHEHSMASSQRAPAVRSEKVQTEETVMEKIGARHSAETQAHHDAIQKCMSKIAESCADAQAHVNALLDKDDADAAARPAFTKDLPPKRESTQVGDNGGQETIVGQTANEAGPTLSKLATLEKSVEELGKSLTNLAEAVAKLIGDDRARVARAAVPVFTIKKEDDSKIATDGDAKSVHELVKQALQKPQRASHYLR